MTMTGDKKVSEISIDEIQKVQPGPVTLLPPPFVKPMFFGPKNLKNPEFSMKTAQTYRTLEKSVEIAVDVFVIY